MTKRTFYIVSLAFIALTVVPAPVFAGALDAVGQSVGFLLASFGAYIFAAVALLFKYSIMFLVFGIGDHMSGQLGFVVNTVWSIMRDLCNLVFIFLFLFIGIRLVLTVETPGGARKALVPILIAALLVNFSLFFAKAIIDVANVAAVAVYGLFGTGNEVDVAAKIAGALGLQSFFDKTSVNALQGMDFSKGIMMMIFFLVAAIAFLIASVMLIKRYVVLLLGMIVSPLVLVFRLVPNVPFLSGIAKKTQAGFSTFISSAFYPAVFLFLIYLAVQIVGSYTGGGQFSKAIFENNGNAFGTIIVYCIGIALLFASMKSASMISDSAANMSMSFARKAGGAATLGAAAFAGRQTLGRLGKVVQEGKVGEAIRTSSINRTRLGRLATTSALQGAEKMRTGSYEIRNTKAYTSAAKTAGVPVGGGWGVTDKGFEAVREEKVKQETELAQAQAVILAGANKAEQEEKEKKAKEDFDKARQERKDAQEYEKSLKTRYRNTTDPVKLKELGDAKKATEDAFVKEKEGDDKLKKAKSEYKEKVENVLVGTKEARQSILHAETASRLPKAEAARTTLMSQRTDTVTRMATAAPQERATMQTQVNELDKKIEEQEKIIESSQVAAENIIAAEYAKTGTDTRDKIKATQTALTGVEIGSQQHATLERDLLNLKREREDFLKTKYAEKRVQFAEQIGDEATAVARKDVLAQREVKRGTDVAQRLRDAAKAARNMKAKQGGISLT